MNRRLDKAFYELEAAFKRGDVMALVELSRNVRDEALALVGNPEPPLWWKLSPLETRMALALAKHRMRSTPQLVELIYGDNPPERSAGNIYVFVHRLRKKLERHGIEIDRHERGGYFVTPDTLPVLRQGFKFDD